MTDFQTLIDADALAELIDRKLVLVLDCGFDLSDAGAERTAYAAGHIPGALHVDLERDLSGTPDGRNGRHPLPDREEFATRMAALGLTHGMQAVSYDSSGGYYASRLWWMLRWAGHRDAAVLDGGLAAWREAGLPLATGFEQPARKGDFTASSQPDMPSIDVDAIEASLEGGDLLVIDARSAERYRGDPHPLDPVSGHIPGARNRFFQQNLMPDGRFKPAAELARDFAAVLGTTPPERTVHQCGSGVTATHNLLAMEIAGMGGSGLYPGSWSEWISDPARPIERTPV
ncbi:MAG TPA: sulfurtransferase [Sphingomonas sp.]|nr:sulfurtransferase [Sphingomonas sp.]